MGAPKCNTELYKHLTTNDKVQLVASILRMMLRMELHDFLEFHKEIDRLQYKIFTNNYIDTMWYFGD